ncbi:hypothetical protein O7623_27880 [Solwaraspora sp. WMMD791]|uniref:hypothetical protein n=1 Tax=Solwaraspora sp. WMMD791 TaxID=3016086 RepID=UPI00249A523B|nr:hypothetical protein [Solwaraspora sp. WMMD791]WFE27033.1 hypothetical protein O7623_27880 [Solwaraspora sp. WMMD791]
MTAPLYPLDTGLTAIVPRQRGPAQRWAAPSAGQPEPPDAVPDPVAPAPGALSPPPHTELAPTPAVPRSARRSPQAGAVRGVTPPADEPVAAVVVGAGRDSRGAVVAALLGAPLPVRRPPESFLLVRHGPAARIAAFLPGWPHPWLIPTRAARNGAGLDLPRSPRRVEVRRPDQMLRHLSLVDTPDLGSLRPAGMRVLVDAVTRAGALVFVIGAGPPPGPVEHDLLRQAVAAGAAVFVVVTPGGVHSEGEAPHRAALLAAVPELVDAPWFVGEPDAGSVTGLRRQLIDWADRAALHRAGAGLAALAGLDQPTTLRTDRSRSADGGGPPGPEAENDWSRHLDRTVRRAGQRVRHTLAIELANLHLAAVQEILFGCGPAGTPDLLDRELLALSLRAGHGCVTAVDDIVDEMAGYLFAAEPTTLRHVLRELLRRRIVVDPPPTPVAVGLLATAAGEVQRVTATEAPDGVLGAAEVDVFAAYPTPWSRSALPPLGLALAADCWHRNDGPAGMAPHQARTWTQQILRAIEIELSRELTVRFAAVRRGLSSLLGDVVDTGDPAR